jgi:GNAT superfamily N-acetyltransferase
LVSDFLREVIPGEQDVSLEAFAAEIRQAPPHRRTLVAVALERDIVVGAAQVILRDLEGHRADGWLKFLIVRSEWRRRGVGTALFRAVSERVRGEGRSRMDWVVCRSHAGGMAFARDTGAVAGLVNQQNRLSTDELDRVLLEGWVARACERAEDYSLVCFDLLCPPEWLEAFAEVLSVMNTAPRAEGAEDVKMTPHEVRDNEQAHLRQGGWGWTVCGCHQPTGRLVGYTELGGSTYEPWRATQGDTGVCPEHRSRGLGRWIKATNALRLLRERPEVRFVETWNAGVNAPMLAINNAMGFRPVADWQEWRLTL